MYTNYIFDLYGTLADIRTDENKTSLWKGMARLMTLQGAPYRALELKECFQNEISREREAAYQNALLSYPEDLLSIHETEVDLSHVIRRLYENKGAHAAPAVIAHWALSFRALSTVHLKLYPGVSAMLTFLKHSGKNICLLSNAQRLFTEPEMRALGIYNLFDEILYSSDIGFTKPSPLFYQALFDRASIGTSGSVMIGNDYLADAWGAHRMGLPSLYVHTAQSPAIRTALPPDCTVLESIRDVVKFL